MELEGKKAMPRYLSRILVLATLLALVVGVSCIVRTKPGRSHRAVRAPHGHKHGHKRKHGHKYKRKHGHKRHGHRH